MFHLFYLRYIFYARCYFFLEELELRFTILSELLL